MAELDAALAPREERASTGRRWGARLPIRGLDGLLTDIADELENGVGIMKLRGFPVDRYEEDDLRRLYFRWARISARRCSRIAAAS